MTPARLDMLTLIIGSDYFRELPAEERAEWWEEAFMEALDALLKMEMRAEDAETELVDMLCRKARTRERELVKERRRKDTVKLIEGGKLWAGADTSHDAVEMNRM